MKRFVGWVRPAMSSILTLNLNLILILSLSLNLCLFISSALAQYFTITRFHSDITIREDSSFLVKEAIEVKFDRPRHGIYRDIPYKYRDEFGKVMETPIDVLSVKDGAGKSWKYRVVRAGPAINIRIGDPDRFVDKNQIYVITYRVENAILFLKDHDELYWNVTGNHWKAPIEQASADVFLAVKGKGKELWTAGYTGGFGSKEAECDCETSENRGQFSTKRSLRIGEGLTIVFGWDKGLVKPPSSWKKFLWAMNLRENWVFLFPVLSILFMVNWWYRKGRDPRVREAVRVMYEPPKFENKPLTPGEVGALVDEKLDPRDITSTIVGLAVKGYIKIEEAKKEGMIFDRTDHYLKKMKEPDANLGSFEIELMRSLFLSAFPGILISSLKNQFYTNLDRLKKSLYGELIRKKYFLSNPEKVRASFFVSGFLVMILGAFLLAFLLAFLSLDSIGKGVFAGVLTGLPIIGFAKFMPAKTRAGAAAYMDILGFQEFMNRAEKDQLERMGDKALFSRFLPYAIALNVADNWARAFKDIYQDPPDWYISPAGFTGFSPYAFTHSVSSVTSDLSSAMFSAPRGSNGGNGGGGGGGGSSGGGFGGGGGGSW